MAFTEEKVLKNFKELGHSSTEAKKQDSKTDALLRMSRPMTSDLRLQAVELIYRNKINYESSAVLQDALGYIHKKEQALKASYVSLRYLKEYVMEQGELSEEVRKTLCNRIEAIAQRVEEEISIPPLVAKRGGLRTGASIVLAVNNTLSAVVLDVGYLNGTSPGSEWIVKSSSGDELVRLRIAEVRRTISAAVPMKGTLDSVRKGQIAIKAKIPYIKE
jgi:hypothetical protein